MLVTHDSVQEAARAEMRVRRALISVFDKAGLVPLARTLAELEIELLSTGGTADALAAAGLAVTPVESITGFPEILDGRVKTLHPAVHAGILFQRAVPAHRAQVAEHDIGGIDLVIVNLYPFEAAAARGADWPELVETIDVGGPSMARAAAKNFPYVTVVTDPAEYEALLRELRERRGAVSGVSRARLARAAFARLSRYDASVARALGALELRRGVGEADATAGATAAAPAAPAAPEPPARLELDLERVQLLRYGENPHQGAAIYARGGELEGIQVLQGKALSYNNLLDLDAALSGLREFPEAACLVFKHASPSGIATGDDQLAAFRAARDADALSAFGGIIGFTRPLTAAAAAEIANGFYEVVLAPGLEADAAAILARKKSLRVVRLEPALLAPRPGAWVARAAAGGYLLQSADACARASTAAGGGASAEPGEVAAGEVVSQRAPDATERAALELAWRAARLVRSNAIVMVRGARTVGIGGGQASRIDAVEVAAMKARRAGHDLAGAVMASDGFFPFRDCVDAAARLGLTAVVEPGGSRRDGESIAAADEHGLAMVFTGRRHFLH